MPQDERDIFVCLNCGHLEHWHRAKTNPNSVIADGEIQDECRKEGCHCDCYSPEICN